MNLNKMLCILIFFCFMICFNRTYAFSDNAFESNTLSTNYQSKEICSDSIKVSSNNNNIEEKIINLSDVKIQEKLQSSNIAQKTSSTVKTTITAKDVTIYYQDRTNFKEEPH